MINLILEGENMYGVKLCLGLSNALGLGEAEQIKLFASSGFEGFFADYSNDLAVCRKTADELGMIFQSVHAPFVKVAEMWRDGENGISATKELCECVEKCSEFEVPIMVSHTYIGFDGADVPNETGFLNFEKVVEHAKKHGVKIAFENTEGEEFLAFLMKRFENCDSVGFCFDTGHEMCYNRSQDMTALYGSKLIATHLNDNLGIGNYDGKITWLDDLHLLPFDGIANWQNIAERLCKCGYNGILTFELNKNSKPDRHDNDLYAKMSAEEYVAQAYARACKFGAIFKSVAERGWKQ